MKRLVPLLFIFLSVSIFAGNSDSSRFYAYHTKVRHTATDYFGQYADLIVVLDDGRQLEFTRQTQYRPRWVTPEGSYMVDRFFPNKDADPNLDYTYVRLLEESSEKIVVQWRYFPNLDEIEKANDKLNPTTIKGFTSIVHEIFTIYPDGTVKRKIKDARGSRYETWQSRDYAHRQTFHLTDGGIEHGPVRYGQLTREPLPTTNDKRPVITADQLAEPVVSYRFDEGGNGFPMELHEAAKQEFAYSTWESVKGDFADVSGHMTVYRKGVSGTALGFDGYYTGVTHPVDVQNTGQSLAMEAWLALDVYPFNEAPVIHKSRRFGDKGYYLGVDAYGKLFLRVNGRTVRSSPKLPLYRWKHVAASIDENTATLYLDGQKVGSVDYEGEPGGVDSPLTLGLNTEEKRCTDYVRGHPQNIPFIYGIQGMMDEVKVYDEPFTGQQVRAHYQAFLPENRRSPLKKAVLPGKVGEARHFGAHYETLDFHALWDKMWRVTDHSDIVVKFDNSPASVIYWRGTNYAANWVTDNNRWMADQSSEIFTRHGCSEHMSDKQCRHSYARIIENNNARVVVHWRYPCVDVGYYCTDRKNYTDEYHTIYPDGTAIRKVVFNNTTREAPGFQDVQYFTNPGETALDVIDMQAVTVANTQGETDELVWEKPNKNPQTDLEDATIQYMNTKSEWKVYALYPEEGYGSWGRHEQSQYTDDPFAGPWNHWPVSVVPSDGRYAVEDDRVTHFALGAGNAGEKNIVHYGFTNHKVESLVSPARYWQDAPEVTNVQGGRSRGFRQAEKAYVFVKDRAGNQLSFTIQADESSPFVHPAFVIHNRRADNLTFHSEGQVIEEGKKLRTGTEYNREGKPKTIVWWKKQGDEPVSVKLQWDQ